MAEFLWFAHRDDQNTALQQVTTLLDEGSLTDLIKLQHEFHDKVQDSSWQAIH